MLGLRFFACDQCATVYAFPEDEAWCQRCDDATLEALSPEPADAAYFAPPVESED